MTAGGGDGDGGGGPAPDPDAYREKARSLFSGECGRCGGALEWSDCEVHHVDRDHGNDNHDNLECLCKPCHNAEHHGDDPLWRCVVSFPRPVLDLLDEAVERNGYASRSEAVNRAVVRSFEGGSGSFSGPEGSVSAWFDSDRHARWVSDEARPEE